MNESTSEFIENLRIICNFGGIPANHSSEVRAVLRHHLEQMRHMKPKSPEFLMSLETAKVLDAQVQYLQMRETCPEAYLWYPQVTEVKPLGEDSEGEPTVSSDSSAPVGPVTPRQDQS